MPTTATDTDLLARVRALAPVVEGEAERAEREVTLTAPVIEAAAEAGLFRILVPRELGGLEADVVTALAVFEELARQDGSTGWSVMANATTSCFAAIYTGEEAARAMFPPGAPGIHAGMLGPVGRAVPDGDGYVVSGRYQFGSGCAHSTWFGGGSQVWRDGEPAVSAIGLPDMRVFFLPADRVELRGNWDVMGLEATGSFDYAVAEQHVDAGFTFPLLEAVPQRGGPGYGIGLFGLTAAGHAAFALGVGARALEEVLRIARDKQRLGADPVAGQQLFLHDFAMHDAAMRSARAYVFESFAEAEAAAVTGTGPDLVQQQRMRQATTYATRIAADAARFAYVWAGTNALRSPSVLQRCFRDIHAGTQHIYVDNNTLTAYTQAVLSSQS